MPDSNYKVGAAAFVGKSSPFAVTVGSRPPINGKLPVMKNFLTLLTLLILAALLSACTPDGEVDVDRVAATVDAMLEDVDLPTNAELRDSLEAHIATLPPDEQAVARRELDEFLAAFPEDGEAIRAGFRKAARQLAEDLPSRQEAEALIDRFVEELPEKEEVKRTVNEAIDEAPEKAELSELLKRGLSILEEQADSIAESHGQ